MTSDEGRREEAKKVDNWRLEDFLQEMIKNNIKRTFLVYENGVFTLSHPEFLNSVKSFLEYSQDFDQHEAIFIGREDGIDTLFFAFVHDTRRGLAQGGLRFWKYETLGSILVDGMRLAQGMTRKNALAGLWWGGGKGIMPLPTKFNYPDEIDDVQQRRRYFEAYGRFVASLRGIYYTAEDVGTKTKDMESILSQNRFTTCIPSEFGGSGNPSPFTAVGVLRAIEAAWQFLTKANSLKDVRVAIQGVGNVGKPLIYALYNAGAKLWITDLPTKQPELKSLRENLPGIEIVENPEEIYSLDVDIFCPCARGGVINVTTIPKLKVKLICGAANNILQEPLSDAELLKKRNIAFVPDFVCNRMGITNCADEWMGYLEDDVRRAAEKVYPDTLRVFKHADSLGITTTNAANQLADIAASELHPLIGHRGRRIIDHLIFSTWAEVPSNKRLGTDNKENHFQIRQIFDPIIDEEIIRRDWNKKSAFRGTYPTLVASPVTTGEQPHLDSFFMPVVLDVYARSLEVLKKQRPRRILGSDHGGLNLELAIERSIPDDREIMGRAKFLELCEDYNVHNDSAIREQLYLLGVGFEPQSWLNPMNSQGQEAVEKLFSYLSKLNLLVQKNYFSYYCPHCQRVITDTGITRQPYTTIQYEILFPINQTEHIKASSFLLEQLLGAVALGVNPNQEYGMYIGQKCRNPLTNESLPIIKIDDLPVTAVFLVPEHNRKDAELAQKYILPLKKPLYDDRGRVYTEGYNHRPVKEVRQEVFDKLGKYVRLQDGSWGVPRCKRCQELLIEGTSEQVFVNLSSATKHFQRAIDLKEISFVNEYWKSVCLEDSKKVNFWCISRQSWWGNPLPTAPKTEVLSPWFSLAALALNVAGYFESASPNPIDETFVNHRFLRRWVIPTQLISILMTGVPIFQRIHIYSPLSIIERQLKPRKTQVGSLLDYERFNIVFGRQPIRSDLGNVIQPRTLIDRFGADALRLAYILCSNPSKEATTETISFPESTLREARKTVKVLVSRMTRLFNFASKCKQGQKGYLLDSWILARCHMECSEAEKAYECYQFHEVGRKFVNLVKDFTRYVGIVLQRDHQHEDIGMINTVIVKIIEMMSKSFSPLCPFMFEKLDNWVKQTSLSEAQFLEIEPWLVDVVEYLYSCKNNIEISSPDPLVVRRFELSSLEIKLLTKATIMATNKASLGEVTVIGRCLLIRPGELKITGATSDIIQWYCENKA